MSWSGEGLRIVDGDWAVLWSTADAAWLLDVPVREVREKLRKRGVRAAGKRFDRGRGRRHVPVYAAEDVLEALDMGGVALAEVIYGA